MAVDNSLGPSTVMAGLVPAIHVGPHLTTTQDCASDLTSAALSDHHDVDGRDFARP